jgi:DNA polymerase-3 subunit epsilon
MVAYTPRPNPQWPHWQQRLYWWWHDPIAADEIVSLDLETTSLDPRHADILSIGAVVIRKGKMVIGERLELYVEPPSTLDAESIRIHKLRRVDLEGQLSIDEALKQLQDFIGNRPLLGYYVSFDIAVLKRHFKRRGLSLLVNPRIEVSALYHRKVSRLFPDVHLDLRFDTLSRVLDIPVTGRHTALGDAQTVSLMFLKLLKGSIPQPN